jgi:predicted acyl esterase
VRGFLRVSHRHRDHESEIAKEYPFIPMHTHKSTDVLRVELNTVYTVDVELWPTSVVIERGEALELTVSAQDIEQRGQYTHDHPTDRAPETFQGFNIIHFGPGKDNFLTLPIVSM